MTDSPTSEPRLSILIPVRNEHATIGIALKVLEALVDTSHEVLVVYDFAEDTSVPEVKKLQPDNPHFRLVHNTLGKGIHNAFAAGIAEARGDFVCFMLADDIGPMTSIEEMLVLMDQGCDFVSCTRYAHGGKRVGGSFIGHVLSRAANWLFHNFSGSVLTDATTGIKMFRREIYDSFDLQAKVGWAVIFEMAIKAQAMGLKLGEVPISSIDRLYGGQSTFQVLPWALEYLKWFFWGMRYLRANRAVRSTTVQVRLREQG